MTKFLGFLILLPMILLASCSVTAQEQTLQAKLSSLEVRIANLEEKQAKQANLVTTDSLAKTVAQLEEKMNTLQISVNGFLGNIQVLNNTQNDTISKLNKANNLYQSMQASYKLFNQINNDIGALKDEIADLREEIEELEE